MRKKIVAGNWKMNLDIEAGKALAKDVLDGLNELPEGNEVVIIPSFIHLPEVQKLISKSGLQLGAQNNSQFEDGAYTGEVSTSMLQSVGVTYCLVGHSERRSIFKESDDVLAAKVKALLNQGIKVIFCCGELLEERKANIHFDCIKSQLALLWQFTAGEFSQISIAYEPVWAIGTGETASADQAQEMHEFIRSLIEQNFSVEKAKATSILYGGSVKPDNASSLFGMKDIDGGLIGGASLDAKSFLSIVNAMEA
tara:strand:+ start:3461 stop:4219 length:759 start_codon:yes stop_codon:yes gene_type:complete